MAPDKAAAFEAALQTRADKQVNVIALDRLLADMAINHATTNSASYEVKNDPPQVLFSTRPALLVLIDGAPVFRPVTNTNVERIINTRVLLLRAEGKFYLRLMDGWLESQNLNGQRTIAGLTPNDLKKALDAAIASKQVALLDNSKRTLAQAVLQNSVPTIFVSRQPAELLQTKGEPQVASIEGTNLIYVTNTDNNIFVHTPSAGSLHPAFRSLVQVAVDAWPMAVRQQRKSYLLTSRRSPSKHAKAAVLVSVPGTPQAKEALIANAIPQTGEDKEALDRIYKICAGFTGCVQDSRDLFL